MPFPHYCCGFCRANARLMMFTVAITSLAALNALCVPLYLEHQITLHPNTAAIRMAGESKERVSAGRVQLGVYEYVFVLWC